VRGLLIKKPWLDEILDGAKRWEIRGSRTTRRGEIALIESGTGTVVGTAELVDVIGPLDLRRLRDHAADAGFVAAALPYTETYAWVLAGPRRLTRPVRYRHPPGAVIWVKLAPSVTRAIERHRGGR